MESNPSLTDLAQMREIRTKHRVLQQEIESSCVWGFDLPWEVFIIGMSFLTPQVI